MGWTKLKKMKEEVCEKDYLFYRRTSCSHFVPSLLLSIRKKNRWCWFINQQKSFNISFLAFFALNKAHNSGLSLNLIKYIQKFFFFFYWILLKRANICCFILVCFSSFFSVSFFFFLCFQFFSIGWCCRRNRQKKKVEERRKIIKKTLCSIKKKKFFPFPFVFFFFLFFLSSFFFPTTPNVVKPSTLPLLLQQHI